MRSLEELNSQIANAIDDVVNAHGVVFKELALGKLKGLLDTQSRIMVEQMDRIETEMKSLRTELRLSVAKWGRYDLGK